jgi:hypothetical protein
MTRRGTKGVQRCSRSVLPCALRPSRSLLAVAAVCLGLLALAPGARAAVTIGQLAGAMPPASCTTPDLDYLQPSVTGGNLYVAKEAGTIVSWSTNSSGSGATYVLKVFRRTSDPDSFQVMAHSPPHALTSGVNNVPVSLHVESGDMLGYHESGAANSCAFVEPGDNVLNRAGNLADGASGIFTPQNDVRLNLSAVLVPDNGFSVVGITRDHKHGTASITVTTTNPGIVSIGGKGMKKRTPKNLAVKGPVTFAVAAIGKRKRRLARKGSVVLTAQVTFLPPGGDPSTQTLDLKLKKRRPRTPAPSK